ncbi:MAG TPA: ABC transporter permease [Puia sp.]|nr:ABC transporter permease [Puia sp.]
MIRSYFKIAFRNLMKYRFTSFINLFGLAIGLTCCMLILAFILNELSYDKYNKNANRIYRVTRSFNNQDGSISLNLSTIAPAFGPYLTNDFPEIEKMTRMLKNGITSFKYKENLFNENNIYFADDNLFDVFTLKVKEGNPKTALSDPFTVMLSEDMAKRYFGNEDPMNKTIRAYNQFNLKVTGVYKDFPTNSHLHPDALVSFTTLNDTSVYGAENLRTSWGNNSFFNFLLLPENYQVKNMIGRFPEFVDKHMDHKDYNGQNPSKFTKLGLQKLTDIHLRSNMDYEAEPNGDINRVYIFSLIALFILLIACINYMNLSTARSALRAREIGIRKVIGARKKELIFQFLSESVMLCWLATIIAFFLTSLAIPWLNKISGQQISYQDLLKWKIAVPLLLTPFILGIVSGIYPALFMSSFQPVKTLKGLFKTGGNSISLRKVLVVAQFAISIVLIISTAIVFQQLHYIQNKSLGFEKEHQVILPYGNDVDKQYDVFRNTLLHNTAFKEMGRSSRIPTGRLLDAQGAFTLVGDSLRPVNTDIKMVNVDYDFIPVYNIKVVAGRNFSREFATDTASFVLNESSINVLGWKNPKDAVGKDFKYGGQKGHIIGVIADFNFESMHQKIVPIVLTMNPPSQQYYNNITIRIAGNNIPSTLAYLEKTWKTMLPETPFQFSFLNENFDKLYESEQKQATLYIFFACIAIFIACLGLFGLSSFAITQRIKEIGVRKVLGANVGRIVTLLSKDFLKLVVIAAILAFPIAWYAMNSWLKDFAFRVSIEWWVFILAGMLASFIALLTVSVHAVKAANANPVNSLRSE